MPPQTTRNSVPSKQYKYWVDVQDLLNLVKYAQQQLKLLSGSQEESKQKQAMDQNENNSQQLTAIQQNPSTVSSYLIKQVPQKQQQNQNLGVNSQTLIEEIVEKDQEIYDLLTKLIKQSPGTYNLEEVLQLNKGIKKVYLIENQKVLTSVYASRIRQDMSSSLQNLISKLLEYQSKFKSKTLRLCFSSQHELFSIFFKVFGSQTFADLTSRKILNEIWEASTLFRETHNILPSHLLNDYFYFKIELFCRGRALYDQHQKAAKDFILHKAVFENNLPLISRLIKCQHDGIFYAEKNELDTCGNTPLMLAVKLGNVDAVKVLTDLFTCPKLKPFHNFPCAIDIAGALKNKEIIRNLLEANQKIKQHFLDLHKEAIFASLEKLPDFKIDIHFNCKSNFIPFVKNIAPSDTYRIYKQGSKLRLDMTLIGFRKLKCVRGNLSVLFKGRNQTNEGELYIVDHESKSVSSIFNELAYAKIDKDIEDIMTDQQYQKLYKADKFEMQAELDKKGEIRQKVIEGFKAEKHNLQTQFTMTKYRINMQEVQTLQKHKSYEEYSQKNTFEIFAKTERDTVRSESQLNSRGENSGSNQSANLSATFNNPHLVRLDSESDVVSQQMLTQGSKDNNNPHIIMTNSNNQMPGYTQNKKITKKTINASVWLCMQHPLSLESFLPLLEVLSFSSKQIAKLKDYLIKYQLPKGSFPLKAKVPLFLTMKATFALQNLTFDVSDFASNMFTVDEEYMEIRQQHNLQYQLFNQDRLLQLMNKNLPSPNQAAQTLKEIYKLCKTDEDLEEDDDSDSVERANELFNSMLKKVNQSEELLLEMSSFHSEYDSVDLSE